MSKMFRHIFYAVVVMVLVFSSCRQEEDEIIPRNKMARIYAEMLLTDQWIVKKADMRKLADTSLVYEPILEKYGYDSEDYRRSVFRYLDDPERFARILSKTVDIFDERLEELKEIKKAMATAEERRMATERFRTDFKAEDCFPYMYSEPYIHYYDSLSLEIDTLTYGYRFTNIELSDTVFDGLVMHVIIDSTAVSDSIARVDSLARLDSIRKSALSGKNAPEKIDNGSGIRSVEGMGLKKEESK